MSEKWDPRKSEWVEEYEAFEEAHGISRRGVVVGVVFVAVLMLIAATALFVGGGGDGTAVPTGSTQAGATGAAPSPSVNPLEPAQLKGLATSVAQRYYSGDAEVAAAMIVHAEQLTGCDLQGYTGGRGGTPLSDPAERDFIRRDAEEKGWAIAFGRSGKEWLVVAMVCPE